MHPHFNIQPSEISPNETTLFAEVSNEGFSYFFLNDKSRLVEELAVYHLNKKDIEPDIAGLSISQNSRTSGYTFAECVNDSVDKPEIKYFVEEVADGH